ENAFVADQRELAREKLARAKKFVTHLYTTLDMEKGGEVAEQLSMLYVFIIEKITTVQATGDTETISDLRAILDNVKSGWSNLQSLESSKKTG
ncbi:flagellar protein FliS, partial [bacterium AH-315-F03]|nr:flagellar protein FliS [bacterium AH-315-F03]